MGHSLVMTGQVTKGLAELEKAHRYLLKLNNTGHAQAVQSAMVGYQAQFFQFSSHTLSYLEKVIEDYQEPGKQLHTFFSISRTCQTALFERRTQKIRVMLAEIQ